MLLQPREKLRANHFLRSHGGKKNPKPLTLVNSRTPRPCDKVEFVALH